MQNFAQTKISRSANRKNLLQLIILRWIAIFAQLCAILFCTHFLEIHLALKPMLATLFALILLNFLSLSFYKSNKAISDKILFFELLCDVFALSLQLYFSGGASNPFISLFLLQVIISAILLRPFFAWITSLITILLYILLGLYSNHLHGFNHHNFNEGKSFDLHLQGMLLSYIIAAILLVIFITKISKNLRERDIKILEQQEVLRSAMIATAAAHDLGTPLATISVILNDLKTDSENKNINIISDITLMEEQIERCKKSLSKILLESGNERLESANKDNLKNDL